MKAEKRFAVAMASVLIIAIAVSYLLYQIFEEPSRYGLVTYSKTVASTSTYFQRKMFFAQDYLWLFCCNGSHILLFRSKDYLNWEQVSVLCEGISSSALSVTYSSGNVFVGIAGAEKGSVIFMKGAAWKGGINWTVQSRVGYGDEEIETYNGCVAVDNSNTAWVSWLGYNNGTYTCHAASSNDGGQRWTDYSVLKGSTIESRVALLQSEHGTVHVICISKGGFYINAFEHASWQVVAIAQIDVEQCYGFSTATANGLVHVTCLESGTHSIVDSVWNRTIQMRKYVVVENQTSESFPCLTVDESSGRVYCFWIANGCVYMKSYVNGAWDKEPRKVVDRTGKQLQMLTCIPRVDDGRIGLAWTEKESEIYSVWCSVLYLSP